MPKKFAAIEQNQIISKARKRRVPVQIFLKNGSILLGRILRFDLFCLLLKTKKGHMIVYKHAISTVIPLKKKKKKTKTSRKFQTKAKAKTAITKYPKKIPKKQNITYPKQKKRNIQHDKQTPPQTGSST